jgi:hypothetical protein
MAIQTSLGEVDLKLNCAVAGVPFLALLENLNVKDVDIEYVVESKGVIVKNLRGTVKGNFVTMQENAPLSVPVLQKEMFTSEEKIRSLLSGLGFCRYNVSKDSTTGPLCGLHVKEGNIFSTDRFRIMRYTFSDDSFLSSCCTLPIKFVNALLKVGSEIKEIGIEGSVVLAVLKDGTKIWSGLLIGDYMDLDPYIPNDVSSFQSIQFPEKIKGILAKHIAFLKDVDPVDKDIKVLLEKGNCTFVSVDKNLGNLSETIDVTSTIEDKIEFVVNPLFLDDISNICSEFFYKDGLVVFKTDKLTYLVKAKV